MKGLLQGMIFMALVIGAGLAIVALLRWQPWVFFPLLMAGVVALMGWAFWNSEGWGH